AELQEVAASLGGTALALDITEPQKAEPILAFSGEQGEFDIILHNAGITHYKILDKTTETPRRNVLAVNLGAPWTW
ncbi:short chain dehydrogenase, partial [Pseudomonas sp. MWU13-2860]